MRGVILFFCFTNALVINSQKVDLNKIMNDSILIGKITLSELQTPPFSNWYVSRYENYNPDRNTTKFYEGRLDSINIRVFIGTWCRDTQRLVPKFFKILSIEKYPVDKIEILALDRNKSTPNHIEKKYKIKKVPTIIFYKNGKELNRIVEYEIGSLEEDILKIITHQKYVPY